MKVKHVIHVSAIRPTLVRCIYLFYFFCETFICLDQVCNGLINFLADGFCDDENNNVECYFDGGDCCFDVYTYFCVDCHCYHGKDHVTTLFMYVSLISCSFLYRWPDNCFHKQGWNSNYRFPIIIWWLRISFILFCPKASFSWAMK